MKHIIPAPLKSALKLLIPILLIIVVALQSIAGNSEEVEAGDFSGLQENQQIKQGYIAVKGDDVVQIYPETVAVKKGNLIEVSKGRFSPPPAKFPINVPSNGMLTYDTVTGKITIGEKAVTIKINKETYSISDVKDVSISDKGAIRGVTSTSKSALPLDGIKLPAGTKFGFDPNKQDADSDETYESFSVDSPYTKFTLNGKTMSTFSYPVQITPLISEEGEPAGYELSQANGRPFVYDRRLYLGSPISVDKSGGVIRETPAEPAVGQGPREGAQKIAASDGREQISSAPSSSEDEDSEEGSSTSVETKPAKKEVSPFSERLQNLIQKMRAQREQFQQGSPPDLGSAPTPTAIASQPVSQTQPSNELFTQYTDLNSYIRAVQTQPPSGLWDDEKLKWNELATVVADNNRLDSERGSAALKLYRMAREADITIGRITVPKAGQIDAMQAAAALRLAFPANSGNIRPEIRNLAQTSGLSKAAAAIVVEDLSWDIDPADLDPQARAAFNKLRYQK